MASENTARAKALPSGLKPWKKGQSGNPGGRPKGIAARARELVDNDPQQLLDVFLGVARNENARDSDRITAAQAYLERGWGKAASFAPVEEGDPLGIDDVDRNLAKLEDELAEKRQAKTSRPAPKRVVARTGTNGRSPD